MSAPRLIDPQLAGRVTLRVERGSLGVPRAGDTLLTRDGQSAFTTILAVRWCREAGPLDDVYAVDCMAVALAHLSAVRCRWYY
jgi:hypothetical protein